MKHGTQVTFRTSLTGKLGRGHKLSKEIGGVFLDGDPDEQFCRIIVDDTKRIVVARTHNVKENQGEVK